MAVAAIDPAVIDSLRQLNQDGEPDVVQEVLTLFLNDAADRLRAIAGAIERGDGQALERSAHAFKGAAGNIGAAALQEHCRQLEHLGKAGQMADAAGSFAALSDEFARVKAEAEQILRG